MSKVVKNLTVELERISGKCRQEIGTKRNIFKTTEYYGKHCMMEFLNKVFSYSCNSTVFLRAHWLENDLFTSEVSFMPNC